MIYFTTYFIRIVVELSFSILSLLLRRRAGFVIRKETLSRAISATISGHMISQCSMINGILPLISQDISYIGIGFIFSSILLISDDYINASLFLCVLFLLFWGILYFWLIEYLYCTSPILHIYLLAIAIYSLRCHRDIILLASTRLIISCRCSWWRRPRHRSPRHFEAFSIDLPSFIYSAARLAMCS